MVLKFCKYHTDRNGRYWIFLSASGIVYWSYTAILSIFCISILVVLDGIEYFLYFSYWSKWMVQGIFSIFIQVVLNFTGYFFVFILAILDGKTCLLQY